MERSFFSLGETERVLAEPLAALRHELHEHPERSGQERETTERLRARYNRAPFEILPLPLTTGLAVRIPGKGPGKRVAIRADMDALPVAEWEQNPIRSQNDGVMHACGHDMHMAFVYGAGLLLSRNRDRFCGEVLLVFQPAEEIGEGARQMLDAGLFERYPVDHILGGHVKPELSAGRISVRTGPVMAALDGFFIEILGQGGHGACPHTCRAMRTVDDDQRTACLDRFRTVVESTAAAMGCQARITFQRGMPPVVNDDRTARICRDRARALLGEDRITALPVDTISEDFSLFAQRAPGCYIGIGTARPGENVYPLHSDRFCPGDELLPLGATVFAEMALGLLNEDKEIGL